MIFVHSSDLCCCSYEQISTNALLYLCQHFYLIYSLVYTTEPDSLPFLNASSAQKWKTKTYKSVTLCNGFAELQSCALFQLDLRCNYGEGNNWNKKVIFSLNKVKKVLPAAQVGFTVNNNLSILTCILTNNLLDSTKKIIKIFIGLILWSINDTAA